ncbi:MAG: hypothetical protein ACRDV6_00840 [Acidimicrobiales bacterium]
MNETEQGDQAELEAEWGGRARREPRWPASIAVAVAIGLQVVLPDRLVFGPRWVAPALEGALGIALLVVSPQRHNRESSVVRSLSIGLIALINVSNLVSLGYLVDALVATHPVGGKTLIYSAVPVWATNIIVFGLWYWELDRGGPSARVLTTRRAPDFLFPQMMARGSTGNDWSPSFLDYLYTSFTNVTAFSPTDTMPLTPWAKLLMMLQSLASLLTLGLVISRAVNIL